MFCAYNKYYQQYVKRRAAVAKTRTGVSVDKKLLEEAQKAGLNCSAVFQSALETELKKHKAKKWLKSNQEALFEYSKRIEKEGTLAEQLGVAP